jgi:hypothetical protein
VLVTEVQRYFSSVQGILRLLLAFLGQKTTFISRLKRESLRARHAAVKQLLNEEYKLHRLIFDESKIDRKWDRVTFSDESTFSSTNDGPFLVYRHRGERYNCQCMSTCKRTGRVSVHYWGRNSCERAGILHRKEGHLDGLQNQHILQNIIMALSCWFNPLPPTPLSHSYSYFISFSEEYCQHAQLLPVAAKNHHLLTSTRGSSSSKPHTSKN